MYFTAIGAVMIAAGIVIREYEGNLNQLSETIILYFSGGLGTATFWVYYSHYCDATQYTYTYMILLFIIYNYPAMF